MKRLGFFVLALASLPACLEAPDADSLSQPQQVPVNEPGGGGNPPDDDAGSSVCKPITLSGKVFYNDQRKYGRFADRKTILPTIAGSADPYDTTWDHINYLGLWDGKVSIYEVDLPALDNDCNATELAGSTQINNDGTWTWTGTVCDPCSADFDGAQDRGVSVAAKISLQKCDNPEVRCFAVQDPGEAGVANHYDDAWTGTTWSRWYRGADNLSPRGIHAQTTLDLGVDYFQEDAGLVAVYYDDQYAQAANVFASMVDVSRQVHLVNDVDFDHATWGQINAFYPSVTGGTAHSHQADRLCIVEPEADWVEGAEAAHEYGHLVHYWSWAGYGKWGSYCFDSDGDGHIDTVDASGNDNEVLWLRDFDNLDECAESSSQREYAISAFKEAWAEFIARVTFDGANVGLSCASIASRTPRAPSFTKADGTLVCPVSAAVPPAACVEGRYFWDDVEQALCDLWDPVDGALSSVTNDDRLDLTLVDLLDNLATVFLEASVDEQLDVILADSFGPNEQTATSTLGLCRFAEKLVEGGISEPLLEETLARTRHQCNL